MLDWITRSVRRKLLLVVLTTTFAALVVSAITLFVYDLRAYQHSSLNDLATQADLLAGASAAALVFNDPQAARENLAALQARPQIRAAAIYAGDRLFASYHRAGVQHRDLPATPPAAGYRIRGNEYALSWRVVHDGEAIGTVYLRAHYAVVERLKDYLGILAAATAVSMVIALLVTFPLQAAITRPITAVTEVARGVLERRDYSQRVAKTTRDEIGVLVDAFNDMLTEVGRRSAALESSNRTLQGEMAERQAAEAALREADRRKDEFLATLAHELRNPLAPIRTGLQILQLAGEDRAAAERARAMMERQLRHMVRLIDDLLDVSRISRGKIELRRERLDLAAAVGAAVETSRPLLEESGQELTVELPAEPVWMDGDMTRLAQVFANLLNNAAKYTPRGGHVRLSARREGEAAVVEVRDDGLGIPADQLEAVFGMFTQVARPPGQSRGGLGIGLSIVRRLVEMHGGSVVAESAGAGTGSTFTVRLPALAAPPEPAADPGGGVAAAGGRRVLVADDNEDAAAALAMVLGLMGYEVHTARDGQEAVEAAEAFRPEVILLDIGMPRLDGYEACRRIRGTTWGRGTQVVALTGWGQEEDRRRSREAGFDRHLVKPVEPAVLLELLARPPATVS